MTNENYNAAIDAEGLQLQKRTRKPKVICMDTVEPRDVTWLWENRIPRGCITLLSGRPGLGKSFVTCDLAARISRGGRLPDGTECERGSVLMIACEDDPAYTIRPRLNAANADPSKVHLLSGIEVSDGKKTTESMFTLASVEIMEEALENLPDCRLVIIDPIGSYIGGETKTNSDNEVRSVLAPIAKLAEQTGAAVLIVTHTRKAEASHIDDTVMGSVGYTGIARSVWHLMADPEHDERRLLLQGKCNIASSQTGLSFRIDGNPAIVTWGVEPVTETANEILAKMAGKRGNGSSAVNEAADWLKNKLANGRLQAQSIKDAAKADGIGEKTLNRASKKANVTKRADGFGGVWYWELPGTGPVSALSPNTENSANTAQTGENLANTGENGPVSAVSAVSAPLGAVANTEARVAGNGSEIPPQPAADDEVEVLF